MSNNLRLMLTAAGLGLAGMILAPRLSADEWDQQTTVTVKEPVEVPGQVLSPGTYTFRLLDSLSDRDIVQVFNKDQTKLYTTVIGIPAYRSVPAGHTVITLEERPAGTPEAIKDWFYPGSNYGLDLLRLPIQKDVFYRCSHFVEVLPIIRQGNFYFLCNQFLCLLPRNFFN